MLARYALQLVFWVRRIALILCIWIKKFSFPFIISLNPMPNTGATDQYQGTCPIKRGELSERHEKGSLSLKIHFWALWLNWTFPNRSSLKYWNTPEDLLIMSRWEMFSRSIMDLHFQFLGQKNEKQNFLLFFNSGPRLFSYQELSIVLKHPTCCMMGRQHSFYFSCLWGKNTHQACCVFSQHHQNLSDQLWNSVDLIRACRDMDPGTELEQKHRRDLKRRWVSHSIIHAISQTQSRVRWKSQDNKPCSRAPLHLK